jgi:hypothetical protein
MDSSIYGIYWYKTTNPDAYECSRLASDRRIQALLIAFSFGAFIEGAAGRIALNLLALLVQKYKY